MRPGPLTDDFVQRLRLSKKEQFDPDHHGRLTQSGMAVIDDDFTVPPLGRSIDDEPSIETFVVDPTTGAVSPTGVDEELNQAWLPTVASMAKRVLAVLAEHDVEIAGQVYVTTSITPVDAISDDPHFDDDQFSPASGVGVVAIVADQGGPRVACSPIDVDPVPAPASIEVTEQLKASFNDGTIARQEADAHQLVLFSQFGQLHAGPGPTRSEDHDVRHLLVLRAATVPG